jgi:hypothetical protein
MSAEEIKHLAALAAAVHAIPEDAFNYREVRRAKTAVDALTAAADAALGEPEPTEAGGDL